MIDEEKFGRAIKLAGNFSIEEFEKPSELSNSSKRTLNKNDKIRGYSKFSIAKTLFNLRHPASFTTNIEVDNLAQRGKTIFVFEGKSNIVLKERL